MFFDQKVYMKTFNSFLFCFLNKFPSPPPHIVFFPLEGRKFFFMLIYRMTLVGFVEF